LAGPYQLEQIARGRAASYNYMLPNSVIPELAARPAPDAHIALRWPAVRHSGSLQLAGRRGADVGLPLQDRPAVEPVAAERERDAAAVAAVFAPQPRQLAAWPLRLEVRRRVRPGPAIAILSSCQFA